MSWFTRKKEGITTTTQDKKEIPAIQATGASLTIPTIQKEQKPQATSAGKRTLLSETTATQEHKVSPQPSAWIPGQPQVALSVIGSIAAATQHPRRRGVAACATA